ncbi:uncharacterized protein NESG_00499 [Nematocida ausubeli]|uniref:Uncharacterized protein n=1 Tax=Nematocida ausubeli (strain ATCC PRA-371 / ERTm2) TaxID=1913371 RepID=A0A086J5K2_NEMA1|nr:uncharacterized protein NESG_00499 [Nematocida ausubeli]KFG27420.1 hypothetical protein NESG_00499 [Nematocida ausubeli]
MEANKTGRRWTFTVNGVNLKQTIEERLRKDKRVRYCIFNVFKKDKIIIKGYIEFKTSVKKTGVYKVLGLSIHVKVLIERREREEIIKEIKDLAYRCASSTVEIGERYLKKGGRPRKDKKSATTAVLKNMIDLNNYYIVTSLRTEFDIFYY